ncbi:MAG: hypothetical protein A2Y33_15415 [Spirochaetes bacterium GWF1_51_8]|nr:MAG: hypothetical protein A2Y33_15415 [Spirochaetes bacterium GWF1_51_8]
MKQKKFFEKFLQNLSKIDEYNLKNIIELLESERRTFREVLDWLNEGIIVFDKDNIFFINREAQRILRAVPVAFPITFAELDKHVYNRDLYKLIDQSRGTEGPYSFTFQNTGDIVEYYELELSVISNSVSIMKICDMTSQKQLEFQLNSLESIAALNTLAAGIAHEIKNPLSAIDLHTQLIQKGIEKGMLKSSPELDRFIEIIKEETSRLNNILNDFLLSTRRRELKLSFEDVNEYMKSILSLFQPEFEINGIEMDTELGSIQKVFIDHDYLKQAIVNLLKNSIESIKSSETKKILIRTFYNIAKDAIGIEILDSGVGIDKKDFHKIFEPYYTTRENGTGLGLTIVYKIIKEHGGEIAVDSRKINEKFRHPEPYNTAFTVYLPTNRGTKLLTSTD